ncbi:MAG: hypothetical protein HQ522_16215 [Bacteroidetes bacterium]|nr:hypothetical protein [Bacteroidota bacterium]
MGKIRVNEAFAQAEAKGKKIKKIQLAEKLWPGSSRDTQQMNISNLLNGKTKRVDIQWIPIICEELGCTPNFLFKN